jgi:hypothetical protein
MNGIAEAVVTRPCRCTSDPAVFGHELWCAVPQKQAVRLGVVQPDPDDAITLRLVGVDESHSGYLWTWVLAQPGHDEPVRWRTLVTRNRDLAKRMKQTFDAFEVPPDTDTDELTGRVVLGLLDERGIVTALAPVRWAR